MHDIDRRPTAIALKTILAISSFTTAIGWAPLPGSLRNGPDIFGQTAASALCAGCVISVIGIVWQQHRDRLDGMVVEQIGLVFLFVGCLLYAFALTTVPQFSDAAIAFGMSLGLSISAAWQYWVIRGYRNRMLVPRGAAEDGR